MAARKIHKSICVTFTENEYEQLQSLAQQLERSKTQTLRMGVVEWTKRINTRAPQPTPQQHHKNANEKNPEKKS